MRNELCVYVYVCVYVYASVYVCVCVCVSVCVCVHACTCMIVFMLGVCKRFSLVYPCAASVSICIYIYPVKVSPYTMRKFHSNVHVCLDLEYDSACMAKIKVCNGIFVTKDGWALALIITNIMYEVMCYCILWPVCFLQWLYELLQLHC